MRDLSELRMVAPDGPAPSHDDFREFEEAFNVVLPESYKTFLRYSNGGGSEACLFNPKDNPDSEEIIVGFHSLTPKRDHNGNIWSETAGIQESTGPKTVSIGSNGAGDEIYLDCNDSPPSVKMIIFIDEPGILTVADSFEEFIDMLQP